jgi:hypothetical protein
MRPGGWGTSWQTVIKAEFIEGVTIGVAPSEAVRESEKEEAVEDFCRKILFQTA